MKRVPIRPLHPILIGLILAALGCSSSKNFGDARFERRSDALFVSPDRFSLPEFPIDRRGEHRFRVRGLPAPAVVHGLLIRSQHPASHPAMNPPWKDARFDVIFLAPDNSELSRHTVGMVRYDTGIWKTFAPLGGFPHPLPAAYTDYDVRVIVREPSRASGDRALLANAPFPPARRR